MQGILTAAETPPLERLRRLVHAFIRSECDEAEMRGALNDSAPLYRDAPEAREARAAGEAAFRGFVREVLPEAPDTQRERAVDLVTTTLSSVGKDFSRTGRSPGEIAAYADAMADMFCAYLRHLQADAGQSRIGPARSA